MCLDILEGCYKYGGSGIATTPSIILYICMILESARLCSNEIQHSLFSMSVPLAYDEKLFMVHLMALC